MKFVWESRLDTGVLEIDEQHQQIVALIGLMADLQKKPLDFGELQKLFDSLNVYAHDHFACERIMVFQAGLSETSLWFNHQGAHEYYMKRIADFRDDIDRRDERALVQIGAFLKYWWVQHICHEDMLLVEVLKEKKLHDEAVAASLIPDERVRDQS